LLLALQFDMALTCLYGLYRLGCLLVDEARRLLSLLSHYRLLVRLLTLGSLQLCRLISLDGVRSMP
jgi:hypothetical protein